MAVQIPVQRIQVPPGRSIWLQAINWDEFESILDELGQQRAARVAYCDGTLEIMTPLPEHEYFKETLGDAIKEMNAMLKLSKVLFFLF